MNEQLYDDISIERSAKEYFGINVEIDKVIVRHLPISRTGEATIFLTTKKQLFIYVHSQSRLLLSDIKKTITRIGLKPELFLPPKGRPTYFDDIGKEKFHEVFPSRTHITPEDIAFYRTLAPYNPALVQISEVKNGEIYQYDSDARQGWRMVTKFTYRRIMTS